MIRFAFVSLCLALGFMAIFVGRASARQYCSIEIINTNKDTASVFVTFDDRSAVHILVHTHEAPHYVSLFYDGYCHSGAHVRVELRPSGHTVYDQWTNTDSTVRIIPF